MIEARADIKPAAWQITATTINCQHVNDAVTLMIDRDWTTRCTWYRRYKQKSNEDKKQKFENKIKLKITQCAGPECPIAISYRDKLIKEEFGTKYIGESI
jgi:hypothetical protein